MFGEPVLGLWVGDTRTWRACLWLVVCPTSSLFPVHAVLPQLADRLEGTRSCGVPALTHPIHVLPHLAPALLGAYPVLHTC